MGGRIPDHLEHVREDFEGDLGCLGNALVLMGLVMERVSMAVMNEGQHSILEPAVSDLERAGQLITLAQSRIVSRYVGANE